jgi:Uma2 family endonuclease
MNAKQERALDFDELLEMEARSPVRHEYIGGRLYAMAGGTPRHARISMNLSAAVHTRLRGKPCHGTSPDQKVRISESATNWYYPDFLVARPPHRFHPRDKNALLNPHAIFEVLSPETERFDRTGKFDEYEKIAELSDYIMVDTETVRVEHFVRSLDSAGGWTRHVYTLLAQELKLDNFGVRVPLSEIYEDVEINEQLVLPIENSDE